MVRLEDACGEDGEISQTLRRLHLVHRDVSPRESRRLTPPPGTNIAWTDIADASASLRNPPPIHPAGCELPEKQHHVTPAFMRSCQSHQNSPRWNIIHQRITYEIQAAAKECYTAIKS